MVTGWLFSDEENGRSKVYIDPIIVNKKMDFPTTMKKCMEIHATLKTIKRPDFAIENVSYQRSLPQMLKENGLSAREIKVGSQDKRSRLAIASHKIKNGEILFPRKGAEDLINQMVHFGTERHDDIADAFVALVIDVIDYQPARPQISWVSCGDEDPSSHNYDTPFCHGGTWRTLC
jgi:predicted phage terminase large subunit-like protein